MPTLSLSLSLSLSLIEIYWYQEMALQERFTFPRGKIHFVYEEAPTSGRKRQQCRALLTIKACYRKECTLRMTIAKFQTSLSLDD